MQTNAVIYMNTVDNNTHNDRRVPQSIKNILNVFLNSKNVFLWHFYWNSCRFISC